MTDSRNIGQYSRFHSNPAGSGLVDGVDFPHSGLLKALSVGLQNSYAILNGTTADATKNFSIVQTNSSGNTQFVVRAGKVIRDGKLMPEIATATFTQGTPSTFDEPASGNAYFVLVVTNASTNVLAIRGDKADTDVVPQLTAGDIPVAIIKLDTGGTVDGRSIQYLTTAKSENSLTVGYDAGSTTYTETMSITGASGGTTITSTGTLTLDADDTKITASSNGKPTLTLENTAGVASAANEPEIIFSRTGASDSSTSGDLGRIMFRGKDDGSATHTYAQITGEALDETGGTEDGRLRFITTLGGADNTEFLRISGSEGVIFNHDKNNIDFSIMGDTNDHVLNVDAGTEKVGIGVNDAKTRLTVEGAITLKEQANADADTAAYGQIWTKTATPNELYFTNDAGNDIQLTTGATGPLLTGKHSIWVPSSAMTPLTTNGCTALTQVEMTAGRPELQVLDFAAGADDFCQFTVAFPKSWNEGTVTFQPFWTVTGTNTGTAVWELTGLSANDNYALNTAYPAVAATGAKAHSGTSNDINVSAESGALTITNASADSVTYFKLNLKTASSSQTGTVRLIGIKLFYDINAGNDE